MRFQTNLQSMLERYRLLAPLLQRYWKYHPLDLRSSGLTPITAFSKFSHRPFLININLPDCRIPRGVAIAARQDANNPFINALVSFQKSGCEASVSNVLRNYYRSFQPASSAELFGLKKSTSPYSILSAYGYIYPWDAVPKPNHEARRLRAIAREDATHGSRLGFQGWHHFGPVSEAKIKLESRRLLDTYKSIAESGYLRRNGKDGDIEGVILEANDKMVLLVKKGHHRIAAMVALDYSSVPVRLNVHQPALIQRSQSLQWPNVKTGNYVHTEALEIFDRAFRGEAHHLSFDDKLSAAPLGLNSVPNDCAPQPYK